MATVSFHMDKDPHRMLKEILASGPVFNPLQKTKLLSLEVVDFSRIPFFYTALQISFVFDSI